LATRFEQAPAVVAADHSRKRFVKNSKVPMLLFAQQARDPEIRAYEAR